YGALGGSSLLGKQGLFVLRRQRRRCPDRRERLSRRTLSCSAKLGGTGVPQAHSLQQAPQGRALCGLGTAEALFRRGSRGLQIITVGRGKVRSITLSRRSRQLPSFSRATTCSSHCWPCRCAGAPCEGS